MKYISAFYRQIVFFCLFINTSNAQYYDFPLENTTWVNSYGMFYIGDGGMPVYWYISNDNFCANGSDTIINSILYKQIELCYSLNANYYGALRYGDGQVYYVPKDSLNETLLYDFSLNIGDTANTFLGEMIIENIDTIVVNGTQRRQLQIKGAASPLIEGIGFGFGLFVTPWPNISNYSVSLICQSVSDTIQYQAYNFSGSSLEIGIPGSCNLDLNVSEISQNSFNVFPNPSHELIKLPSNIRKINIFSISGKLVLQVENPDSQLNISGLENGIYIIRAFDEEGFGLLSKFIKN